MIGLIRIVLELIVKVFFLFSWFLQINLIVCVIQIEEKKIYSKIEKFMYFLYMLVFEIIKNLYYICLFL